VGTTYSVDEVGDDPAGVAALATLRRLWHAGDDGDIGDAGFEDRLAAWWEQQRGQRRVLVASYDGEPVGMANAVVFERMPRPGVPVTRWTYVANVFVVEDHRRRGVARLLMEDLLAWARAERMVRVVLAPSEMSVPLYAGLGFRPAHDLMRLDLDH
jgi:GNAT superfamily N-acetyltransferase